jgi:hypothetical protein
LRCSTARTKTGVICNVRSALGAMWHEGSPGGAWIAVGGEA